MEYLLGIDLGTSYFKFSLVDRDGRVCGLTRVGVPVRAPRPGRQEVDPKAFWRAIADGVGRAAGEARAAPREIKGLAYSSQANSFLLLDRHDVPLTPIVLWSDERVEAPGRDLRRLWDRDDYLATTGMAVRGPGLAAAKIDWFRAEEPKIWKETARILMIDEYLTYCLTGQAAGDQSTGGLLGLWDLRRSRWWSEGLDALGLREERLSRLLPPATCIGKTAGPKAAEIGLPGTARFTLGSLDHYAAAVGSGLGFHGDTSESTGTVLACLHLDAAYRPDPAYCIGPSAEQGCWYRLAFGPNGARSLEWLRGRLGRRHSIEELARLAGDSPAGAGGLYAPEAAYTRADLSCFVRPERRQSAPAAGEAVTSPRGAETPPAAGAHAAAPPSAGDYARALMESTARSLGAQLRALRPGDPPAHLLSTGGGARSDVWLQIKADMLDLEVRAAAGGEPGAFGAAIFASPGAGWHATVGEAVESFVSIERRFSPHPDAHRFYLAWNERHPRLFAADPAAPNAEEG